MYGVRPFAKSPLPAEGPALVVCDHTSLGDPLVLLATAGRPIRFVMAEEIYSKSHAQWIFQAFRCVPIRRGERDVQAVRAMLKGLGDNEVMGLFPEGGLGRHRIDEGHPGIGYLAIKSGAPVIPASISWEKPRPISSMVKTLLEPCKATIHYGAPLQFSQDNRPNKEAMQTCTQGIMSQIEDWRTTGEGRN